MSLSKERVKLWFYGIRPSLERLGFQVGLSCTDDSIPNPSCSIDAESSDIIFKLIAWESGDIEIDAVSVDSGKTIMLNRPSDNLDYEEILSAYVNNIKSMV